jgi:hypothetical protein
MFPDETILQAALVGPHEDGKSVLLMLVDDLGHERSMRVDPSTALELGTALSLAGAGAVPVLAVG